MSTLEDRIVQALEVIGADVAALQRASGGNGWAVYSVPHLKFLGNSSSDQNTLDFYERGSFTPILMGSDSPGTVGYSVQDGRYVRIGNYVGFSIRILLTSISGASGHIKIAGLPFIVGNEASRGGCIASYWAGMRVAINKFSGLPIGDHVPVFISNTLNDSATIFSNIFTQLQGGSRFFMHGHYFVD